MWALFAVYQAIHTLIGVGIPPDKMSVPQALTAVTDTVTAGFPPQDLELAVATFLLDASRCDCMRECGGLTGV
jgi:hypothetical protein